MKWFVNLYVETEQLKAKANEIKEIANQLNENMNRIESLVLNLGLEWQGTSEIAYAAKILFIKKQFETLYQFLIDYSDAIMSIANEYEETEKQLIKELNI